MHTTRVKKKVNESEQKNEVEVVLHIIQKKKRKNNRKSFEEKKGIY